MTRSTQTALKMLESLPEDSQEQVVEKLRDIVEEYRDEGQWRLLLEKNSGKLTKLAQKAQQEINDGEAEEMDYKKL